MQRARGYLIFFGVDTLKNEGRCSILKWSNSTTLGVNILKIRVDAEMEEFIKVKASDYLAICNENERLAAENKELREKLGLENKTKKRKSVELDFSKVGNDLMPIVKKWLKYKSEKGQSYKPTGFSTFINKLLKLSGGNIDTARMIIDESIANNWAGIFPLKNNASRMPVGFVQTDNNQNKYKEQTLW